MTLPAINLVSDIQKFVVTFDLWEAFIVEIQHSTKTLFYLGMLGGTYQ